MCPQHISPCPPRRLAASAPSGVNHRLCNLSYVQMLTWIFDSPSTLCPFSLHKMPLAGKGLGQWFGQSAAAGAIKCVDVVIVCRLNVDTSSDLWFKASQRHRLVSRPQSTARSSRQMYIRHHVRQPNLLVPSSYQDGEGVLSSCSSIFGLV